MTDRSAAARSIAGFSAALAALGAAAPADAVIIDLTFDPSSVAYGGGADVYPRTLSGGYFAELITVVNNAGGKRFTFTYFDAAIVTPNQNITDGILITGTPMFTFPASASGTVTMAIDFAGVGWFRVNLGGPGGPITFLAASTQTEMGVPITAGQTSASNPVPLPATLPLAGLGVLALGAAGLRRRRRRS